VESRTFYPFMFLLLIFINSWLELRRTKHLWQLQ